MEIKSHKLCTQKAFEVLKFLDKETLLHESMDAVIQECAAVDSYRDMEFVDVEGGIFSSGRDNPHIFSPFAINDIPHYTILGAGFSSFNHFIDIKKGAGLFDDFDGYSYKKGSASIDEYQNAIDAADGVLHHLMGKCIGLKVDEGINGWFEGEYVHSPAHHWYKNCSPAVERYSYPKDKGLYGNVVDELRARFPYAVASGGEDGGIPYSVFMPVDNMARFWYDQLLDTKDPIKLGAVLHAIQDTSVPHHASGYIGNWHGKYEATLSEYIGFWLNEPGFTEEVKALASEWCSIDTNPPKRLYAEDWQKKPCINWRVDFLVTWVALHAYHAYSQVYGHFKSGFGFDINNARYLVKLAAAMSTLILKKAAEALYHENILRFDASKLDIKNVGRHWKIVVNHQTLLDFGVNGEACHTALKLIRDYRADAIGYIGDDFTGIQYLLTNAGTSGVTYALSDGDVTSFDPQSLEVKLIDGGWKLLSKGQILLDLGPDASCVKSAYWIIKKYKFRHICYLGRPHAAFTYLCC